MKYLLFVALLFTSVMSYAEMYRWVDETGRVRIGERPSAVPAAVGSSDDKKIDDSNEPKSVVSAALPEKSAAAAVGASTNMTVPSAPSPASPSKMPIKSESVVEPAQKTFNPVVKKMVVNKPEIIAPIVKKSTVKKPTIKAIVKKPTTKKPTTKKPVASKPAIKKTAAKKNPPKVKRATQKTVVKKPFKKTVVGKPVKKTTPENKKSPTTPSNEKRNEDMCGVYMSYVRDYEYRVKNCSASLCDIYERALKRYRGKQKNYCGS